MASVLAKLGAAALQPSKLGSAWRKPLISGRNAARLRKEAIATTGYVAVNANAQVLWNVCVSMVLASRKLVSDAAVATVFAQVVAV